MLIIVMQCPENTARPFKEIRTKKSGRCYDSTPSRNKTKKKPIKKMR